MEVAFTKFVGRLLGTNKNNLNWVLKMRFLISDFIIIEPTRPDPNQPDSTHNPLYLFQHPHYSRLVLYFMFPAKSRQPKDYCNLLNKSMVLVFRFSIIIKLQKKAPMLPLTLKPHYSRNLLSNRYHICKHWYRVILMWGRRRKSDWNHRHSLTTMKPIRNKQEVYLISHVKVVGKCQLAVRNNYTESSKLKTKSPKMTHICSQHLSRIEFQ